MQEILLMHLERKSAPFQDDKRENHADELGCHRRDGGSLCPKMEHGHHQKIPENIADAGNHDGDQWRLRIADAAENTADQIVPDDDDKPETADENIPSGRSECFFRRIHHLRQSSRSKRDDRCENNSDHTEQKNAGTDGPAHLARLSGADLLPDYDRDPHRKTGDNVRNRLRDLRSGRNA